MNYKWHYIINLLVNPIIIFTYIALFQTIYSYDTQQIILGYTCSQMIWYFAAINFFYYFVWCEPERVISEEIISGIMAVRLIQPVSVMKITFTSAASNRVVNLLLNFIPTFLIYTWFIYPDFLSLAAFIKYLAISLLSFILFYLFSFMIGTAAFKLQSIATLQSIKVTLVLMAGVFIPLDFLPRILQEIIKALPFQYIYYVPMQFFLNKPETQGMDIFMKTVLSQAIWILIFYIMSIISWRIAVKRFYTVGG